MGKNIFENTLEPDSTYIATHHKRNVGCTSVCLEMERLLCIKEKRLYTVRTAQIMSVGAIYLIAARICTVIRVDRRQIIHYYSSSRHIRHRKGPAKL